MTIPFFAVSEYSCFHVISTMLPHSFSASAIVFPVTLVIKISFFGVSVASGVTTGVSTAMTGSRFSSFVPACRHPMVMAVPSTAAPAIPAIPLRLPEPPVMFCSSSYMASYNSRILCQRFLAFTAIPFITAFFCLVEISSSFIFKSDGISSPNARITESVGASPVNI